MSRIRPCGRRIISNIRRSQLQTTAILNADGTIAVVTLTIGDLDIHFNNWMEEEPRLL
ncbi:MAG: hypothetical protein ABIX01_06320 [Chitinophagaceae bacterium]